MRYLIGVILIISLYTTPIFSNFLFIKTENPKVKEKTLRRYFPSDYDPEYKKKNIVTCDFIDGRLMYVYFYKEKFIKKGISWHGGL